MPAVPGGCGGYFTCYGCLLQGVCGLRLAKQGRGVQHAVVVQAWQSAAVDKHVGWAVHCVWTGPGPDASRLSLSVLPIIIGT